MRTNGSGWARPSALVLAVAIVGALAGCGGSSEPAPGSPSPLGYFKTLAPGAALPTGADCAKRIHRAAWEPKPKNEEANHTVRPQPVQLPPDKNFNAAFQEKYRPRIDGNFTGTTDEIIQWAACKWGISDNLVRAQAEHESHWQQSAVGDKEDRSAGHCPSDQTGDPCPTSFGLLQSKWYFRPDTYPWTRTSTAFMLDSAMAELRGCLDGLGYPGVRTRGDVWGCIGFWYSGDFGHNNADYIADVKKKLAKKHWITWHG